MEQQMTPESPAGLWRGLKTCVQQVSGRNQEGGRDERTCRRAACTRWERRQRGLTPAPRRKDWCASRLRQLCVEAACGQRKGQAGRAGRLRTKRKKAWKEEEECSERQGAHGGGGGGRGSWGRRLAPGRWPEAPLGCATTADCWR